MLLEIHLKMASFCHLNVGVVNAGLGIVLNHTSVKMIGQSKESGGAALVCRCTRGSREGGFLLSSECRFFKW